MLRLFTFCGAQTELWLTYDDSREAVPLGTNGSFAGLGRRTQCHRVLTADVAIMLNAGTGVGRLMVTHHRRKRTIEEARTMADAVGDLAGVAVLVPEETQ